MRVRGPPLGRLTLFLGSPIFVGENGVSKLSLFNEKKSMKI